MVVIHHYSELYVWGLAIQAALALGALLFLPTAPITVASIAPAAPAWHRLAVQRAA